MDHESLQRKLAQLEEEIHRAQSESLRGTTSLSRVALTLDEAIRIAANIRNRLAGTAPPQGKQDYHVNRRPIS